MKREVWMFVAAALAAFTWGCDGGEPKCRVDIVGSLRQGCGVGEGGSGGDSGEYVDEKGVCRGQGDFQALGCPATYELALVEERCGGTGPACGGNCGKWLVVQDSCTPSLGCTYDPASRALVGVVYGDDVREHCDGTSYEVTYGDGYHGCAFQDLVLDRECWLKED